MNQLINKTTIFIALCISAFTLLAPIPPAHAQTGSTINLLGHFGGSTAAVFVNRDTAYIGVGPRLTILDISDPVNPTLIGETDLLPDVILDIEVVGNIAYVANGENGLMTIDITDPAAPSFLGSYDTAGDGRVNDVHIIGSVAYVAYGYDGFVMVDVTDPSTPLLLGSYNTDGYTNDVQVVESIAYVADGENGLVTVDVTDPSTPLLLGSYNTSGFSTGKAVQIVGTVAYMADGQNGLATLDVTDPATPLLLASYNTGSASGVQVVGNVAYVADANNGLVTLDVTDPATPLRLDSYNSRGASDVKVVENVAYVAYRSDEYTGLVTFNVTDPAMPLLLGSYDTSGFAYDVKVVESVAYVVDENNGLMMVDVTDPSTPLLLSSYDTDRGAESVQVVGSVAYVVVSNRLMMVDVTDPAAPSLLASYDTPGSVESVQVIGSIAYMVVYYNGQDNGLVMVDITNPAAPSFLGYYNTFGVASDVQVVGNVAYVADAFNGLVTVDVTDPTMPSLLGSYDTDGRAKSVHVVGSIAYVADDHNGLVIVDVSDPTNPSLLGDDNIAGYASGVQIVGSVAYVAYGSVGLVTLDVTDPTDPSFLAFHDTAGNARSVHVVDDVIYVASGSGGLYILEHVPDGDAFEIDDGCAAAAEIETNGTVQEHSFHDANDVDWVKFDVEAEETYQLLGQVGVGSPADLVVEVYIGCEEAKEDEQNYSFAPGVRLGFTATEDSIYYVKLYNEQGSVYGDDVTYELSIQTSTQPSLGGVTADRVAVDGLAIIVAGRQGDDDPLQSNIHTVTNDVYNLFYTQGGADGSGYDDWRIHYLATDLDLDPIGDGAQHVDGTPSLANLTQVISDSLNLLGDGAPLTLYMMSHGLRDELFFDGANGEAITPNDLDSLLTWVEEKVPGVVINVVIDACYSGSFIATDDEFEPTLSKPGRVIVTSASEWHLAWASRRGSRFSDFFINALRLEYSIAEAFQIARSSTRAVLWRQNPQLDDNGNGVGNDLTDGAIASERGFSFGNFSLDGEPSNWPPYIAQLSEPDVNGGQATVEIELRDDKGNSAIKSVWAMLVPPSYIESTADNSSETGDLVLEQFTTFTLTHSTGGYYTGTTPTLMELGEYEVVFYAEDMEDAFARPVSTTFINETLVPANTSTPPPTATKTPLPIATITPEPTTTPTQTQASDVPLAVGISEQSQKRPSSTIAGLVTLILTSVIAVILVIVTHQSRRGRR